MYFEGTVMRCYSERCISGFVLLKCHQEKKMLIMIDFDIAWRQCTLTTHEELRNDLAAVR